MGICFLTLFSPLFIYIYRYIKFIDWENSFSQPFTIYLCSTIKKIVITNIIAYKLFSINFILFLEKKAIHKSNEKNIEQIGNNTASIK